MPTLDELLGRGYLPKELPTPFNSRSLATAVSSKGLAAFNGNDWLRPVTHNLARPGRMYRRLSVPHPKHFVRLAEVLASNWAAVESQMSKSRFSLSTAVDDPTGSRAIGPRFRKSVRTARRATTPPGSRYVVRADVSQFYPSVYTHALDWAFGSKAASKQAAKAKVRTSPGAMVDSYVAWAQDGQTMGIPIGPDTSFALGELVMSRVDETLVSSLQPRLRGAVRGTRFYDDYELFAPDRATALKAAAELQRALAAWELTLNPYKFGIDTLPMELDDPWIAVLRQVDVPGDNASSQRAAFLTLFSEAFRLRRDFPDENVLAYAMSQFVAANFVERQVVLKENWAEFEGLILQCAENEPATLPRVAHLLCWYDLRGYPLSRSTIRRSLQSLITSEGVSAHGSEVAWALWTAILLDLKLNVSTAQVVSRMDDDIVALLALHGASLGLVAGLDTSRWAAHMSRSGLYEEHWLLAYEALHHGWLPSVTGRDYTRGDLLFGFLRRNGVCFYDETAQIVAPVIPAKTQAVPGHVGLASLAETVDAHRDAVRAVLAEPHGAEPQTPVQRLVLPVGPEDLYE